MTRHLVNEPLHGVAVYNPGILSKQELIRLFVARRQLFQQIIDDLYREKKNGIPQHRLLVGARGMGKSTLLRRISYAIEDDTKLNSEWLPLTFPEEQYNVARLSDLWLNCLDALSDAFERQGKHNEAESLDEIVDNLPDANEDERARKALNVLLEQAQKADRRLLLLIDNLDLIFERLAREHWTIREMLSKEGAPLLIGATSRPLEPTYEYKGAFYDFFKISNLNKLQLEEMHEVLRSLAAEMNVPQVARLVDEDPARIRVLYDLTGGNPRTTVLLFGVLAQGMDGDVRTDLERLLDHCTPLYKARFEELSSQAQQVVDALALHWDPATAATVAEQARLDVNSVSSHLNRLSEQGIVEKVRLYPKKKAGFQLAERFFNIWYLMRASRRMRRKLVWLTKFLKSFYSQEDLCSLAKRYLSKESGADASALLKHAEYGFALAEALDDKGWRRALEHSASRITLEIHDKFSELLSDSAIDLDEIDQQALNMKQIRAKILDATVNWNGIDSQEFCDLFCGYPLLNTATKRKFSEGFETLSKGRLSKYFRMFLEGKKEIQEIFENATNIDLLYQAVNTGLMKSWDDVEGAESAQHVLDAPVLIMIALGMRLTQKPDHESLRLFKKHLAKSKEDIWAWRCLGDAESKMGLYGEAEKTYRKGLKISPNNATLWFKLGTLLGDKLNKNEDALLALEKAVELDPAASAAWCNYGNASGNLGRTEDAEKAFMKSIELNPQSWHAWYGLAKALGELKDYKGAERAYRKALAINPDEIGLFLNLGLILWRSGQEAEAEKIIRRGIKKHPKDSRIWNHLGLVQMYSGSKTQKAETSFKKAIELDSENALAWRNWGRLLQETARYSEAEQKYRHTLQLVPDDHSCKLNLAEVLVINKQWSEAATLAASVLKKEEDSIDDLMMEVLSFLKSAVNCGHAEGVITLLEQAELDESWRPVIEALSAIQAGTKDYLLNIAPEVRNAAEEVYEMLTGKEENAGA